MTNTDDSASLFRVLFIDIKYQKDAEFVVTPSKKDEITIMLDQDVSGIGGFFSGEYQISVTREQAVELVRLMMDAFGISNELDEREKWYDVGRTEYIWSDHGELLGARRSVQVLCRRGQIRVIISSDFNGIPNDYIATFGRETGERFADAISNCLFLLNREVTPTQIS